MSQSLGFKLSSFWQVTLDPDQAALVIRALRGKLKEEDIPVAEELAYVLTMHRAAEARSLAKSMEKHLENAAMARASAFVEEKK